jgi:HEAT repeat protein
MKLHTITISFHRRTWIIRVFMASIMWISLVCSISAAGRSQDNPTTHSFTPLQLEIEKQKQRLGSTEVEERRDALMRLGGLRRAEASKAALSALADPLPIIRATAASALSSLPAEESAAALIPLLNDKDEFVRQQVSYALGGMKNRFAAAALRVRLSTDKFDSVRGAAAVALGEIRDESAVISLAQTLQPANSHRAGSRKRRAKENEFVLRAAAHSLGQIGSRAGTPVLIEALLNDSMPDDVRREAAYALGLIGDPSAVPALRSAVTASDPYLSQIAAEALRKIS